MRSVSNLGRPLALVIGIVAGLSSLPASADEAFVLKRTDDGIDGRPLDSEQTCERFLSKLDAIAGPVLGRQQEREE